MVRAAHIAPSRPAALRHGLPLYVGKVACASCHGFVRYASNRHCANGCSTSHATTRPAKVTYQRTYRESAGMRATGLQVTALNRMLYRLLFNF